MTQEEKESLKWLLVEAKAIVDTENPNPFAGIFLNNLCDVIDEFIRVRTELTVEDQEISKRSETNYCN